MSDRKTVNILGIRGLPASHGGFETFAEHFALYMHEKGWKVRVYCQEVGDGEPYETDWNGVSLIHIPVSRDGSLGSIFFDFRSSLSAAKSEGIILTLGYNTAIFSIVHRLFRKVNIMNMDGIEWKRQKWHPVIRCWFYLNELAGSFISNHLIADHPEIKKHLCRNVPEKKVTIIPYAANDVFDADESILAQYGLSRNNYFIVIARPEPENSILEIVAAFSKRPRNSKLVVLGKYSEDHNYHRAVQAAASSDVLFVGAIYEKATVEALRFFSTCYIHGHRVGGTNPSLVEALGAGSAVLAHKNKYNEWVAGKGAVYFSSEEDCDRLITEIDEGRTDIDEMKQQSRKRKAEQFTFDLVHKAYEDTLCKYYK